MRGMPMRPMSMRGTARPQRPTTGATPYERPDDVRIRGNAGKSPQGLRKKIARRTEEGKKSEKARTALKSRRKFVRRYKKAAANKPAK